VPQQARVHRLTSKWRGRSIGSLREFKVYHRKFLELVGRAIGTQIIDQKEADRYFWEGIQDNLRNRIETRLFLLNPELDVSIPFSMSSVIKAVETLFNRKRFNQHLFSNRGYGSDTESEDDRCKPSRTSKYFEEDTDSDSEESEVLRKSHSRQRFKYAESESDDSDQPRKRRTKRKSSTSFRPQLPIKSQPTPAKTDEVARLTEEMGRLKLLLLQKDPEYRDIINPPSQRYN
jgi:hypothetical protein